MIGLGTIANVGAIVVGGLIGMLVGGKLKERFQSILMVALGLAVIAMSITGFVSKMLVMGDDATYVLLFSLVIGAIIGEIVNFDDKMERLGVFIKSKTGNAKDSTFVEGFVNSSLTVCIGAMAIVGAIEDGINRNFSILFAKSILDFITIMVFASRYGKGCIFSALPVAVLQGTITVLARFIGPLLTESAINNLSMVGNVLIVCVGVNMLGDGKYRIKLANLVPAVILAVVSAYIF